MTEAELTAELERLEAAIDCWAGQGYALANPQLVAALLVAEILEAR